MSAGYSTQTWDRRHEFQANTFLNSPILLLWLAVLGKEVIVELHKAPCHLICLLLLHEDGRPEVKGSLFLHMADVIFRISLQTGKRWQATVLHHREQA